MSNNWIYVGADINKYKWSKVGKTTRGLESRHTSSQSPDYFIYTAFNIISDDVHEIEQNLLLYLEFTEQLERIRHFSTGSKSECFNVNPYKMTQLVEFFIEKNYSHCVTHEFFPYQEISRYQCQDCLYWMFSSIGEYSENSPGNLGMSRENYFTGNYIQHETDLGGGYFIDNVTGMQGYRYDDDDDDDDDHVEWSQWK